MKTKSETYVTARTRILTELASLGWTVKPYLKLPQAISPDKSMQLFFRPQAVYLREHSTWLDIRNLPIADFVAQISSLNADRATAEYPY